MFVINSIRKGKLCEVKKISYYKLFYRYDGVMGASLYTPPKLNISLSVSTAFNNIWSEYEEETLMQDIIITPTIEDYINNLDPVLEAVSNE